jgi:hypothetical protein
MPTYPSAIDITIASGAIGTNFRGTRMSYCYMLGGCSKTDVFHPRS